MFLTGFLILAYLEDELTAALYDRIKHIRKVLQSLSPSDKEDFLKEIEKEDYKDITDFWKEYLRLEALKLLDVLVPIENRFLIEVEHYRLIPEELRAFLESTPENMFKLARLLQQALVAQERLAELENLLEYINCIDCTKKDKCIIFRIIKKR